VGFSLQRFSAILKLRDASGQPYLLIGGVFRFIDEAATKSAQRIYRAVTP
jgi:hypothetical protein